MFLEAWSSFQSCQQLYFKKKRKPLLMSLGSCRGWSIFILLKCRKLSKHERNDKLRIVQRIKHGLNQHCPVCPSDCNFIDFNNPKLVLLPPLFCINLLGKFSHNTANNMLANSDVSAPASWENHPCIIPVDVQTPLTLASPSTGCLLSLAELVFTEAFFCFIAPS